MLLCAVTRLPAERAARVGALLGGALNWELVTRSSCWQGVMPLVYRHLSAGFAERVPEAVLQRLKRDFYGNSLRNRYLAGELVRLTRLFEAHGLSAIAYKGPTLAQAAYGDLALRQFVDLDILVRQADFAKAAALLTGDGYRQWFDTRALESGFFQASKDVFTHHDGLRQVDLHWRLTPRYFPCALDPDSLWARSRRVALEGGSLLTLAPQDLMLALCAHASRHGWVSLSLVCDVAELLRSEPQIDWGEAVEEARRLRGRRMVLLGLYLAHELLGAEPPRRVLAMARSEAAVLSLANRIKRRLFAKPPDKPELFQPWLVPLRTIERARDRLRYCLDRALAPTVDDDRFLRLPKALLPLHYLLRPLRLALRHGYRLIGEIVGGAASTG